MTLGTQHSFPPPFSVADAEQLKMNNSLRARVLGVMWLCQLALEGRREAEANSPWPVFSWQVRWSGCWYPVSSSAGVRSRCKAAVGR